MRILHTSDWHLGRSFHREGMLTHQGVFVDHLLEVVERERVDLVVVAGDIYDRALPQVDAVRLASEALVRLADSRARVVLTSGNHDSAHRLGFGSELIDAAGVFIRTDAGRVATPIMLDDEHGPVAVYGVPYLDPDTVREPWELATRSHAAALGEAMRRIRGDLRTRPGLRSVVLAHAFVANGSEDHVGRSDSERDISVGGVQLVPTSVFEEVSYAALGHLHGRQTLTETVRYSGSPLAYSFSEVNHHKGSWLVELGPTGVTHAEFVDAPVPRGLALLRGELETLLTDPALSAHEDSWVQVTLTDPVRPMQAMERLRRRFPHTLLLGFESTAAVVGALPQGHGPARRDRDLVADFVAELRGAPATTDELALLGRAVDACCDDPDVDVLVSDGAIDQETAPGDWAEVLF